MRIPDWYRWNLGWAYYQDHRYDEALAMLSSLRSKPGERAYVPETALFTAAANYRKSMALAGEGFDVLAASHMDLAVEAIRKFRKDYPDFELEFALTHRSRFQSPIDEEHWMKPLRLLWNR